MFSRHLLFLLFDKGNTALVVSRRFVSFVRFILRAHTSPPSLPLSGSVHMRQHLIPDCVSSSSFFYLSYHLLLFSLVDTVILGLRTCGSIMASSPEEVGNDPDGMLVTPNANYHAHLGRVSMASMLFNQILYRQTIPLPPELFP